MKLPYYALLGKAVKANLQGGRGGACTTYYSAFDPEADIIAGLQDPRATEDARNRDIHFAMLGNRLFAKKIAANEKIFVYNSFTAPDLSKKFFSGDQDGYEELYNKYAADETFKKTWIDARKLLVQADTQSYQAGTHYHSFIDEMNRHTPFLDPIYSSNLCVAPETMLLTSEGHVPIASKAGQMVQVWNGKHWSLTQVVKTGENQSLWSVTTDSGMALDCTPYHKWYVFNGYGKPYLEKRTHELFVGDKLCKFDLPVIEGQQSLHAPYENGFYSGDGCRVDEKQRIYLYGEKQKLEHMFPEISNWQRQPKFDRILGHYQTLQDKFFVPDAKYSIDSRLRWLEGYFDADGCVQRNGTNQQLVCTSTEFGFLQEVQLMLQTLGVTSKIRFFNEEGTTLLPKNDGSGQMGEFYCKRTHRLLITSGDLLKLMQLGFAPKRLEIKPFTIQRQAVQFVEVIDIQNTGRIDDTYCVNEPYEHKAVFNGMLTGQCTEISLPTMEYLNAGYLYREDDHGQGEVALCSLGAINVAVEMTDEQYEESAYATLLMIDRCIHMSHYELPHVGFTAKQRLNAGVGIIGLATALARKNLKYSSKEGLAEIHRIFERHAYFLIKASLKLGKELGNAPWMHKTKWPQGWLPIDTYKRTVDELVAPEYRYDWETLRAQIIENGGIRNSCVSAHMPTESSSKATGAPNGPYGIRALQLLKTDGSNSLDWVAMDSDLIGDQYEIAWKIPTLRMIEAYAVMQKFTDQGISADAWRDRTENPDVPVSDMVTEYLHMVKYGLKGRYYQNSLTTDQSGQAQETDATRGCSSGACTL